MSAVVSISRPLHVLVRFAQDQRGMSAVEFALVLPLMLTLYLGTAEISQGVGIDRKVTLTTRTAADLAARMSGISTSDMTNLLAASSAVIAPYDPTKLKVTVSLVSIDANSSATVSWSCTLNGTKRGTNSSVTLPTAFLNPSTALILSEVSYTYKPTIGYVITGTLNLSDQIYMRPRLSDSITGPSSC
jgi:Flp pilus assembly protein TadG